MKLGGKGFLLFARLNPDTPGKLHAHALSTRRSSSPPTSCSRASPSAPATSDVAATRRADPRRGAGDEGAARGRFDHAVDASLAAVGRDDLDEQLAQVPRRRARARGAGDPAARARRRLARRRELARLYEEHLAETREHAELDRGAARSARRRPVDAEGRALRLGALNWGAFFQAHPDTPGKLAAFAFAFEHLEIGGYEQLRRVAERAGDAETAALAAQILEQERTAADSLEHLFPHAAGLALAASAGR